MAAETLMMMNNSSTEESIGDPDKLLEVRVPSSSSDLSIFQKKIEFHLARKPFNGFSNGGGDFRLETLNPTSFSPGPKPLLNGKKADVAEILENGLDPELSITFRRIGAGLENLGNTCFLNSVLQCLTYTEPLAAYLQSGKHQTSCRTAGFCALCAIQKHVSRALQSTGRILAPKEIVSNLRCISRSFRNSRQEDAHEYMVNLLESMHKCCLPSGVPSESPGAYDKSLVHKIFGGRLRSQVKCMQCFFCSNKFDPFLDLSLEIVKAESLNKALAHFTAKEQLDGGEKHYQCQQCKQKVKALKQLTIHKAPYVLTVHLKRFGSHLGGQKIDKRILFEPTLDLKPFVTGPYDGDLKYTLYGVLVHAGWSTHSGHYYCFVRTTSGMWYSLDDNRVVQVGEKKVLEQKAYMLFYYRDRRSFASKKPLDVVQKEKMTMNAIQRNATYPNFNQGSKETIRSDPIEKRLNAVKSSAVVAQRDSLIGDLSKDIQIKEGPTQDLSGLKAIECSAPNKDLLAPSKVPPLKDSAEGIFTIRKGELLPRDDSSGSNVLRELDNSRITTSDAKILENDLDSRSKEDVDSVFNIQPCNRLPNSVTDKDLGNSVPISPTGDEKSTTREGPNGSVAIFLNRCIPEGPDGDSLITEKATVGKSGKEASSLDSKGRNLEKNDNVMLSSQTVGENSQGVVAAAPAVVSNVLITKRMSIRKKIVEGKPRQRLKNNLSNFPVTRMRLSSKILLGTSLSIRKKKHKRNKLHTSGVMTSRQKHLEDGDRAHTDLGPSTSEKFKTVTLGGSANSQRKGTKSSSKNKEKSSVVNNVASNFNNHLSVTDKDFKERICQNGTVLAVDDQSQKSSTTGSTVSQCDGSGPNSCSKDSRRDLMQNGLMSMLTRGLEETIVARWDEIVSYPSHMTESSGLERVSIGYVGDEWDEEYDRGKRKKVRSSKNDFALQNPFQEIATTNAKLKKARLDQSSSGNKPFRI